VSLKYDIQCGLSMSIIRLRLLLALAIDNVMICGTIIIIVSIVLLLYHCITIC
jgi:hypothetical protein